MLAKKICSIDTRSLIYTTLTTAPFSTFSIHHLKSSSCRTPLLYFLSQYEQPKNCSKNLLETRRETLCLLPTASNSCRLIDGFQFYMYNYFYVKYVFLIKSFTYMFQILEMQYRRRFIHIHPFQVFSYVSKIKIQTLRALSYVSGTNMHCRYGNQSVIHSLHCGPVL